MDTTLRVDADALRRLATTLSDDADQLHQLNPARPFETVAAALPVSKTGTATAAACDPVQRCYRRIADQVRAMSASAIANADSYSDTDEAFRRQFAQYRLGVPCDPR